MGVGEGVKRGHKICYIFINIWILFLQLSSFFQTKSRHLPAWHINDEIEGKVIKYAKLFFECKLDEVECDEMFGCQILDVLDSMINMQFRINVKYYPQNNVCSIDAVYKLRDPHVRISLVIQFLLKVAYFKIVPS